ncbi:MAG: Coronin-like protein crn1 [Chaenotheca gracillima]|nr:MAG: Coronin-like protein crn1 [Chaenotheca gracillima]
MTNDRFQMLEQCYDNLRISNNAWDTNLVKVNPKYLSVNWEASGGGAFAVIPLSEKGRLPEHIPLFRGHTATVLDTDWNPFNDSLIASGSDDGKVFLWTVPEDFTLYTEEEEVEDVAPVSKLTGHSRKVGHVLFNPAAENVLATASGDYTVKLWDAETGSSKVTLKHGDIVQGLSWSADGSLLVTTCRDKKLRIWDARQQKPAHEVPGHSGAKNSRVVWMGEHDRVATTGFSKMSDRQLGLWDIRDPKEPIGGFQVLDSISGVCMPFWDEGTQSLYLAGKGDGNIRYFEYANDKFEFLSEYKSGEPQRGIAFMPKRAINTHENEVMRAYKTVNDSYIEPISFIVPRRAEVFQGDIYPPTTGDQPGVSASDWFAGKNALPPKVDLESIYAGEEPVVVPATQKESLSSIANAADPAPTPPSPVKKEEAPEPRPTQAPQPVVSAVPAASRTSAAPGSIKQAQSSISDMASKFADKDVSEDESSSDDDSEPQNFDEPAPRAVPSAVSAPITNPPTSLPSSAAGRTSPTKPAQAPSSTATASSATMQAVPSPSSAAEVASPRGEEPNTSSVLSEIRDLLEQQSRTISAQSDQIGQLTAEVSGLKTKFGEASAGKHVL